MCPRHVRVGPVALLDLAVDLIVQRNEDLNKCQNPAHFRKSSGLQLSSVVKGRSLSQKPGFIFSIFINFVVRLDFLIKLVLEEH